MTKKHIFLSLVLGLVIGCPVGSFVYAKTLPKQDDVAITACVIVNKAVKYEMMDLEQVKELGWITGRHLKTGYPAIASKFFIPSQNLNNDLETVNCSAFLKGFSSAKKS
ncbi:hypothetical protein KTI78_14175 [Acinetobacter sp. WU_MDCI_Abxe161]|uniref:hypothetical protein n=1 Tax=Acinetobacter sp. WU_MDCI_Abxe161 TaxID=2850074 RepID=UPI0021CDA6A5|nr:hypothetical protein [Acinetobacter sp. WU_MDCI_Abxe161]MCU4504307.1 hypothetical protein [Acinetobacter sp. WU_MDCI_Abxe161]